MPSDSRPCTAPGEPARAAPDLFEAALRPDEQLHPRFRQLRDQPTLAPARGLLRELHAAAFRDGAPGFVERFQSSGFDDALFELFLYALFRSAGHRVDLGHRDPALLLTKADATVAVDALTVGRPATGVDPGADAPASASPERQPHGLGGSLFCKLQRQQWQLPHTEGLPFVLAIQDFDHRAMARGAPPSAILNFLFGGPGPSRDLGELFPEGFFGQQGAEHVSGILFCNDATMAKFNRLGQEAHGGGTARMLRHGTCLAGTGDAPGSTGFVYEVGQRGTQREQWNEGTVLIHNPSALHPLPTDWLGASAEMELRNGCIAERFTPGFHPCSSRTELMTADTPAWWIECRARLLEHELAAHPPA